jgi:hypothetical protein
MLNTAIRATPAGIVLDQSAYVDTLLEKFNMTSAHPVSTPFPTGVRPLKSDRPTQGSAEQAKMRKMPYRQLVMSLSYLAQVSRPDIAYVVSQLARHQENPGLSHWHLAQRVLRYLKGSRSLPLLYKWGPRSRPWQAGLYDPLDPTDRILAFADADFAGSDDFKSTTGYCIHLHVGSSPIIWGSVKQKLVSRSTTEAETVAAFDCYQEAEVLQRTLQQLSLVADLSAPVPRLLIREDNQAVIAQLVSQGINSKSRYIGVKSAFLRHEYKHGRLDFQYINTALQGADLFTKPLAEVPHNQVTNLVFGYAPLSLYDALRDPLRPCPQRTALAA